MRRLKILVLILEYGCGPQLASSGADKRSQGDSRKRRSGNGEPITHPDSFAVA